VAELNRVIDVKAKIKNSTVDPKVARERLETAINAVTLEAGETITIEDILIGDEALG